MTLTQTAVPTRALVHGVWTNLDAALKANPDGTFSPTLTSSKVVLSGGGSGPAAELYRGGQGFSLSLPVELPRPKVSGASAVYANVIPGVDLTVTVQGSGAVSDVFTVHNAAAAKDPRLAGLLNAKATPTRGLTMAADANGDIGVVDVKGHQLFAAPAPRAWDSAIAAVPNTQAKVQLHGDAVAAEPSTTEAPGRGAHAVKLKVSAHPGGIDLAAPTSLLGSESTVYPVYVDPTYSPSYGKTGWTSVGSGVPDTNYWNGTVDYGTGDSDAEVGNSGDVQGETMSLFNMPVDSSLKRATIYSVKFGIVENYSWACPTSGHDQAVDLYAPSQTLNSGNATWNSWVNNLGGSIGSQSFALGYNSSCPAGGIPAYTVPNSLFTNDLNAGKTTQTLVLRADDHSDNYAYKEFTPSSAQWSITYDKTPNTPSGLHTSPSTNCSSTVLGDTGVTLYAPASTPTNSSLTTTVHLYKTSDSSKTNLLTSAHGITSDTWTGASGQAAVLAVSEKFFAAQAGGAVTSFSFVAQSTDGTLTSGWSGACTFSWDPTRPGSPGIAPNPSPTGGAKTCATVGDQNSTDTAQQLGTSCSFSLTPPTTGGTTTSISGYVYQINQSPPVTVNATGATSVNVPLTRLVNVLTVSALSAGGNIGSAAMVWFDGTKIDPAAKDGDLTLDGVPDLIVPGSGGGSTSFPPGLWLATGSTDGTVSKAATNIGISGLGFSSNATPADWNNSQALSGNFCGNGAQDVMAYFPANGGGAIACDDGSSGPLHLGNRLDTASAPYQITAGSFSDGTNEATQVVNAGDTSGQHTGNPDLLAPINGQLVLFYSTTPNGYSSDVATFGMCTADCTVLSALNTPDGKQDWSSWTLATAQLSSGTAMYLWNSNTGELDLWTGLALGSSGNTLTATGQYTLANGSTSTWNRQPADPMTLRAADITGAGIPDLWAIDLKTGQTTAYLPTAPLANNANLNTATTTVTTAAHAWTLGDMPSTAKAGDPVSSTADITGTNPLTLTGNSGTTWETADLSFQSSDIAFNGNGLLTSSAAAVIPQTSFTVSLWAKPSTLGGTVLAQEGKSTSSFAIFSDAATDSWRFEMPQSDASNPTEDIAATGTIPAEVGVWTHLTVTYNAGTGQMVLYLGDVAAAQRTHTAGGVTTNGPLTLGAYLYNGAISGHFAGSIANVQTFSTALTAQQVSALAGNPHNHRTDNANHDFTGSGNADVVATWNSDGGYPHLYTSTPDGTLVSAGQMYPDSWSGVRLIATGDFNGDGIADVVGIWSDGTAHLYTGRGDGTLNGPGSLVGGTSWGTVSQIIAGDFNGDGNTDILAIWGDGSLHLYPGDGHGNLSGSNGNIWPDNSWNTMKLLASGDYNSDGHTDLLAEWNDGTLHLYEGDGSGHLTPGAQMIDGNTWSTMVGIVGGDFNDDGKTDLVALWGDGTIHLYSGNGDGTLSPAKSMWSGGSWSGIQKIA